MSKKKNNIQKHNKTKSKKNTVQKKKMDKSVFLYGKPNVWKREILKQDQTNYTNGMNDYMQFLYDTENYDVETFMFILTNTPQSPSLRSLEKKLRDNTNLKTALSQSAFDEAVNKVSNQFVNIKNQMYGMLENDFTSSKVLYAMTLYHCTQNEMRNKIKYLIKYTKEKLTEYQNTEKPSQSQIAKLTESVEYYENLFQNLNSLSINEFNESMMEFHIWYEFIFSSFKCPFCKKAYVKLTARSSSFTKNIVATMEQRSKNEIVLEKSKGIKSPYTIAITNSVSNKRIEVPLNTSTRSIYRLEHYKSSSCVSYTIRDDGSIKVVVPIKKDIESSKEITSYNGVDTGMSDAFHTSDDVVFGSFIENIDFYKKKVEPALAEINKLKKKKAFLKKQLRLRKNELTETQIKQYRDKIDHIEKNIRQNKVTKKYLNKYHNETDKIINQVCNEYIASLNQDKSIMTVLEKLDIKEFDKSKHDNSMYSIWVRGQLQKRVMEKLNWNGYQFMEVEPAFTSQTCPKCGYLDKENRNGKEFKCLCCGYEDDSDHVGALNIKSRATDEELFNICEKYEYDKKGRHKEIIILQRKRHKKYVEEHPEEFKNK